MAQDVKIWEITKEGELKEISQAKLDLEERLESWIERDISIVSDDLLVIGRQVKTDFGATIDLLCIDRNGDLAILELKRDKTPRDVVAQALDYASWVKDLSNERITEIANSYLGDKGPLERAFKEKFGIELPEVLNESHKIFIIGSEIDPSSQRIIEYLSDTYGVGINAVTFQYFQEGEKEFLSRVFLIDPSEAEYRTKTKSPSKRKPPLTYEELEKIAEDNGVGKLYKKLLEGLSSCFDYKVTTRSSVAFIGFKKKEKSRMTIFSILPGESNAEKGVRYTVYMDRFTDYFEIDKEKAKAILPSYEQKIGYGEWAGEFGGGYFKDDTQIEEFLKELKNLKQNKIYDRS